MPNTCLCLHCELCLNSGCSHFRYQAICIGFLAVFEGGSDVDEIASGSTRAVVGSPGEPQARETESNLRGSHLIYLDKPYPQFLFLHMVMIGVEGTFAQRACVCVLMVGNFTRFLSGPARVLFFFDYLCSFIHVPRGRIRIPRMVFRRNSSKCSLFKS